MAMTGGTAYKVLSKKANYGSASWTTDLYVYVKVGSYNVANNTTPLTLGMYVTTPGADYDISWDDFNGSYLGIGAFGGGAEALTSFTKGAYNGGTTWLKENVNVTVHHNTDGTAKGVPIKWKWGVNSPWGQYVIPSGSFTIDLPTIPRVSSISVPLGTIGTAMNISISRESSNFTHTIEYYYGDEHGIIVEKTDKVLVSWTPPMELCEETPSAPQGVGSMVCKTYLGDTLIGTYDTLFYLNVPDSAMLKCYDGWVTVRPYNEGTAVSGVNSYIKGYSKAEIVFDASKISTEKSGGATIASYKVVYNSSTLDAPYRTPTLQAVGTFSVICYVYDTRGRYRSITLNFTVSDYANPTMKYISCYRCDASGNADDSGMYIYAKATAVYSDLSGANPYSLTVKYKPYGGSYGSPITLTSGVGKVVGGGAIRTDLSYVVEFIVSDTISPQPSIYTGYIPSDDCFFQGNEEGTAASFGKYVELDNTLDVAWNLMVRGDYYGNVFSLGGAYQITPGEDINNYTNFGVYAVSNHEKAQQVLNLPTPWAGRLIVSSPCGENVNTGRWAYIQQEYITLEGNARYTRVMYTDANGEWNTGPWYEYKGTQIS